MSKEPGIDLEGIGTQFAQLHTHYYGMAPAQVAVHVASEHVVVVTLEETFTMAERVLIERGDAHEVQTIRRRFQQVVAEDFKAVIEQETGRVVRTFTSDTDLDEQLSIEVFVLGARRMDMSRFEEGKDESGSN